MSSWRRNRWTTCLDEWPLRRKSDKNEKGKGSQCLCLDRRYRTALSRWERDLLLRSFLSYGLKKSALSHKVDRKLLPLLLMATLMPMVILRILNLKLRRSCSKRPLSKINLWVYVSHLSFVDLWKRDDLCFIANHCARMSAKSHFLSQVQNSLSFLTSFLRYIS